MKNLRELDEMVTREFFGDELYNYWFNWDQSRAEVFGSCETPEELKEAVMESKEESDENSMWYIVNVNGDVLGEFQGKKKAEASFSCYTQEQIDEEELEIIQG